MTGYDNIDLNEVPLRGLLFQTIRYRVLTNILFDIATGGVECVVIAENEDIPVTAMSDKVRAPAVHRFER